MKIITSFAALDLDPTDFPSELDQFSTEDYQRIMDALMDAYADAATGTASNLCEHPAPDAFLFGAFAKDDFSQAVEGWTAEIKQTFLRALTCLCPSLEQGRLPSMDELSTDSATTYALSGAARELDNVWYDYAEHGVYLPNTLGWPYFRTLLTDEEKNFILANPNDYLIAKVVPK